jgi:molybdenum cofactor cytidylyltransferase
MGRPKQALPYGLSTMAGGVTRTLLDAGLERVVVVTRTELRDSLELPEDRRVHVALNDDPHSQMIGSIGIGLACVFQLAADDGPDRPSEHGVLVLPADMPNVPVPACSACLAAYRTDPSRIVIAAHAGRRGHPMIFPLALKSIVDGLSGGLCGLSAACPDRVVLIESDHPSVTQGIDTPDEYQRLRP